MFNISVISVQLKKLRASCLKIILALLTITIAFTLCSCSKKKSEEIVCGVTTDNYPYTYQKNKDAEIEGLEIDLVKEIAKRMNKKLVLRPLSVPSIYEELKKNKLSCAVACLATTEKDIRNVEYSIPYRNIKIVVVARKTKKIKTVDDLFSKIISVQASSIGEEVAKAVTSSIFGVIIKPVKDCSMLKKDLKNDSVDAVIIESEQANNIITEMPETEIACSLESETSESCNIAIACAKNSLIKKEFDAVLTKLIDEGFVASLRQKWLQKRNYKED
ncbi:substrate-binding periplasmic protein [Candidatus Sneabacter namystus]|uniref:Amino acid ABC transporter substrate-binding protein n=1 Tax=Candidatus Sneabacter namystus TaxID=2601646 RepID=A0A5C0UJB2_9RICK|nr:transporter substrate-binding domain-containing protein [Candidatus Sneabacter namystus]QEK39552.1 amino acid ABC transporter substrate-binding protein [Candidatus Sneabacter namystus]